MENLNTIWLRMAKGDKPTKITGFSLANSDDFIDDYFESHCGGVYKWWRGNITSEPADTSISNNLKEDLLEFEFINTSIASEKTAIATPLEDFMQQNGLGPEDMINDITYPHELGSGFCKIN